MLNNLNIAILLILALIGILFIIQCNRSSVSRETKVIQDKNHMSGKRILTKIGESEGNHTMTSDGVHSTIQLDQNTMKSIRRGNDKAPADIHPEYSVYLELKSVTGKSDATILNVSVNDKYAGKFSLFGLAVASEKEKEDRGLLLSLDVTDLFNEIIQNNEDVSALKIQVVPDKDPITRQDIVIEKINIYLEKN